MDRYCTVEIIESKRKRSDWILLAFNVGIYFYVHSSSTGFKIPSQFTRWDEIPLEYKFAAEEVGRGDGGMGDGKKMGNPTPGTERSTNFGALVHAGTNRRPWPQ